MIYEGLTFSLRPLPQNPVIISNDQLGSSLYTRSKCVTSLPPVPVPMVVECTNGNVLHDCTIRVALLFFKSGEWLKKRYAYRARFNILVISIELLLQPYSQKSQGTQKDFSTTVFQSAAVIHFSTLSTKCQQNTTLPLAEQRNICVSTSRTTGR